MKRPMHRSVVLTLSLAVALLIPVAFASQEGPSLAGTWRLVEFTNYRDGRPVRPFGDEPIGYFFYTESGHLSIQILKNPPPESLDEFGVDFETNLPMWAISVVTVWIGSAPSSFTRWREVRCWTISAPIKKDPLRSKATVW